MRALFFALAGAACLLLLGALLTSRGYDRAGAQGPVIMAIDADTGTAGTQNCLGNVTASTNITVDFRIEDALSISGFGMRLLYDNSIVSIQSADRSVSILGAGGLDVSDPLPDSSNSYLDGYAGTATSSSGVLSRYTLRAEAAGLTRLHLVKGSADTHYANGDSMTKLPDQTQDAFISVGAACPDATSDRDSDGVLDFGADTTAFTSDDDNCPSAANAAQENRDSDTLGNACDPVVMTIDTDTFERKIQTCRGNVASGSFVDLVVRNANINAFQLRLAYDNSVVSLDSSDSSKSVLGSGGLVVAGPPDSSSRMFHSYAGTAANVPNGGVLMRYTVNAVGNGLTPLSLINGPLDSGVVENQGQNTFKVGDQTPLAFLEVGGACPSAAADRDGDGFTDFADKCPNISDAAQTDTDSDAIGDACDANDDNDGAGAANILDANDNCPKTSNTNQLDTDGDGQPGVQPDPSDTFNGAFGGNACDPDDDGDGIDDGIDQNSTDSSNKNFSDGTTSGTIVSVGDVAVRIRDEGAPDGVRIMAAAGSGTATKVSLCSSLADLNLNGGNETVVTCGSATVEVITGPVAVDIGSFLHGTVPTATTITVDRNGAIASICNDASSSGDAIFTGIAIAPGACDTDSDTDGFFDFVEAFVGTAPATACGVAAWPANLNDSVDNTADIFDVGPLKSAFGSVSGEAAYSARVDLNAESLINIADVAIFKRFLGQTC